MPVFFFFGNVGMHGVRYSSEDTSTFRKGSYIMAYVTCAPSITY